MVTETETEQDNATLTVNIGLRVTERLARMIREMGAADDRSDSYIVRTILFPALEVAYEQFKQNQP